MSATHPQHGVVRTNARKQLLAKAAALHKDGKLDYAAALYKRVIQQAPGDLDATYGLGLLAWQTGDLQTGVRLLRLVLARLPNFAEGHYNLGRMLQDVRNPVAAIAEYHQALALKPDLAPAWGNLGNALRDLGSHADALLCYRKALALAEAGSDVSADAHYNIAYPLLSMGRWTEGWAAYERRFDVTAFKGTYVRRHEQPLWDGMQDLNGKRLLLHAEQGMGDTLMTARYIPALRAAYPAMDLVVEVPVALYRLFKMQRWADGLTLRAQREDVGACDYQLPMMSLMDRFHTEPGTVPVDGMPYITVEHWPEERLKPLLPPGDGMRVGFTFAGNRNHKNDANRSLDIVLLKPLFQVQGITWTSLQVDYEVVGFQCQDVRAHIRDFADTTALIDQLDLVITVDTAIAHLAGMMAKPTFTMLPAVPDFRWMLDSPITPWYPTMHLFRQQHAGDWPSVVERIRRVLVEIISTHVPP